MNITSAQYVNHPITNKQDCIKATVDNKITYIPLKPDNRHYQAIQEWVAEGNKIEDAD
mgnify:FL=1